MGDDGPEGGVQDRARAIPARGVRAGGPLPLEEGEWPTGISLSGGGIRSAAFSLGVLQELQAAGLLRGPRGARYLSAVSGGSYIAGSAALVALGAMKGEPGAEHVVPAERPFEPGSPEEQYLRNHTTYLLHGPGGVVGFVWRLVLGIVLNVAFLGLVLHAVARPLGWAYGWAHEGLRQGSRCLGAGCEVAAHVAVAPSAWLAVGAAAAVGLALGLLAIAVRWRDDAARARLAGGSAAAMAAAGTALVVLVGLPALLGALRDATVAGTGAEAAAESSSRLGAFGGAGLLGTGAAALLAVRAGVGSRAEARPVTNWVGRRAVTLLVRLRMPLVNLLAAVFGPLLLVATFVAFVNWGAGRPPGAAGGGGGGEVAVWAGAGAVLLVMWRWADLVAWSLHPFYKRRLSSAFALRRVQRPGEDLSAEERPYRTWYRLSQTQPPDFPELLVCAAANISDYGRVPTGSEVTSFVFSAASVGGPVTGHIATTALEEAVGPRARDLTLPAAVSIAGAAFSPSMGKMTRAPLRFLLAVTNLRLGVWVPNPLRVQEFRARRRRRFYPVSPRPHYLLRELFGRNHAASSFLYVSDGGHYENLGLVELLRRHCMDVWCVDASGDAVDTFDTLAEAMLIAQGELDVEVRLDPTVMAPDPAAPRFVRRTHAVGELRYPDGTVGRIVVVKTGVPADAPWEVRAFQDAHPTFPCDSTLNQFFTAERFDAYRTLGRFAGRRALDDVGADARPGRVAAPAEAVGLTEGPRAGAPTA